MTCLKPMRTLTLVLGLGLYHMSIMAMDLSAADKLLKQGRYKKAAVVYRESLNEERSHQALYGLAKSLLLQRDYVNAASYAAEAKQQGADEGKVLQLQGKIALKQNQLESATAYYLRLLSVAPEEQESYLALMEIAERQGDAEAVDQWHALYQARFAQE